MPTRRAPSAPGAPSGGPEPTVDRLRPREFTQFQPILDEQAEQGRTLAIIDTPGASIGGIAAILRLADLVPIPIRPSRLDLIAALPAIELLAGRASPTAWPSSSTNARRRPRRAPACTHGHSPGSG